ncbi:MAG TPA: cysteine methyltransferase [Planctomycetaceae bacterium]|nr:cysteine methyltransferase [Planctomycetaceae bacterium]
MPNKDIEAAFAATAASIRFGEVVSYGEVARRAGYPRHHRAVGRFLSNTDLDLPWWRVVYGDGRIPPINPDVQRDRLLNEGVQLKGYRVLSAPSGPFAS